MTHPSEASTTPAPVDLPAGVAWEQLVAAAQTAAPFPVLLAGLLSEDLAVHGGTGEALQITRRGHDLLLELHQLTVDRYTLRCPDTGLAVADLRLPSWAPPAAAVVVAAAVLSWVGRAVLGGSEDSGAEPGRQP